MIDWVDILVWPITALLLGGTARRCVGLVILYKTTVAQANYDKKGKE
jgi:hypothetical protein